MSFALDANILLYSANSSVPEHKLSLAFLESCADGDDLVCLAWPTIMAFLRISTHPRIFPNPLRWRQAHERVQRLLALPNFRPLAEQDGFWDIYRELADSARAYGNLIPDAHLAAILRQHNVTTLYTNDSDFRRFDFLTVRNPLR